MPYSSNQELPDAVKNLPEAAQTVWREAFNAAVYDQGKSEQDAAQIAWAAVETAGYPKTAQATFLAGIDLKELVTQNLESETEVQIALTGHYVQGPKEFDITLKDFADAEKNFFASQNPLPVDYEHNTFVKGAEAPAAGWVKKVINRGEKGLYAVIAWTKGAAERIRSSEYKFISPVFFFEARDTKTGASIGTLLGPPALTNFPLIQGMQPVTAKRIETQSKETFSMWKSFLAKLGFPNVSEEATEEKAVEIIKAKMSDQPKIVASTAILKALDLPETASEDDVKGKILALKHPGNTVSREDHDALLAKMRDGEITGAIDGAIAAGKVYPHERDWMLHQDREWNKEKNPALLKAFLAGRPKLVPVNEKLKGKKEDLASSKEGDQTEQLIVAKMAQAKSAGKTMSYRDAAVELSREQPELFKQAEGAS